ncbi:serine/threonine protein kinase [Streptomyces coeruleorubidus]|uniref:serine/threonine protein kinase n=1 Tax=Streptomyces coeruleorubidus TaxID=116188 RepID=UPI0033F5F639
MKPLDADTDPRVLGPFELLARLGEGGMGVAYLARRIPLDGFTDELAATYHLIEPDEGADAAESRLAVVKMIQPHLLDNTGARERFTREIDTVRAVVSDRVPALLAADTDAEEPWFAMDYVDGPSLHTLVKESGTFPVGPYAALGLYLVDALRAIHGTGLLHRDLKPANVVLGPDGPVVLDFGLATLIERRTSQAITTPGEAWGTKPYMSYEQLHDFRSAKEPTDVYALGATLFFVLTGRPPYPQEPLLTPPHWHGVEAGFRPLLAQILVDVAARRPDLDGVEMGLRALLHEAELTQDLAVEQLRALVEEADLAPELPPEARSGNVDPEVQGLAQRAVDARAVPDALWADDTTEDLPSGGVGFFGIVDTDEIERAEDAVAQEGAPAGYTPTAVDHPEAPPAAPVPAPAQTPVDVIPGEGPGETPAPTSYPLQPPRPAREPAPVTTPSAPPRGALRVAERLRKAYAHSGNL